MHDAFTTHERRVLWSGLALVAAALPARAAGAPTASTLLAFFGAGMLMFASTRRAYEAIVRRTRVSAGIVQASCVALTLPGVVAIAHLVWVAAVRGPDAVLGMDRGPEWLPWLVALSSAEGIWIAEVLDRHPPVRSGEDRP